MNTAAASPLPSAEPKAHRHALGYAIPHADGPSRGVTVNMGRAAFVLSPDEANSLALALARAASDSQRVQL